METNRKSFAILISCFVLLLVLVVLGQTAFAQRGMTQAGIAMVDVQYVLGNSSAIQTARAQFSKLRANYQQEVSGEYNDIVNLRQSIERQRSSLTQEAYQQQIQELNQKTAKYRQDVQERDRKLKAALETVSQKIIQKISMIVDEIKTERKYPLVLARTAVVGTPAVPDLTKEVLERLNRQMPSAHMALPN